MVEILVHLVEAESLEVAGILVLCHRLATKCHCVYEMNGTYVVLESQVAEQIQLQIQYQ